MSRESTPNTTAPEVVEEEQHETQPTGTPTLDEMIAGAKSRTPASRGSTTGGPGVQSKGRSKVCH